MSDLVILLALHFKVSSRQTLGYVCVSALMSANGWCAHTHTLEVSKGLFYAAKQKTRMGRI